MAISHRGNGRGPDKITADVIVIGSGPGGAVTAAMCAEAGKFVVMLEEGQYLPLESAPHFSREEILQKYRNAGVNIGFGAAKLAYVEGCCVGGGSEINRGLYHRTPEAVLDHWRRDHKVDALSLPELTPHFAACEKVAKVEYLPGPAPHLSSRLEEGAHRLAWEVLEVPRLYTYATDAMTGAPGRKQSMSETFVPRFLNAGGELVPDTCARRITHVQEPSAAFPPHVHLGRAALRAQHGAPRTFRMRGSPGSPADFAVFLATRCGGGLGSKSPARPALLRNFYRLPDLGGVAAAHLSGGFRCFGPPRVRAHAEGEQPALRNLAVLYVDAAPAAAVQALRPDRLKEWLLFVPEGT